MYRPLGPAELALVKESGFKKWPPRLQGQSIFYPVANETYAKEITIQWNVRDYGVGYVARFSVRKPFVENYLLHKVGNKEHYEWWIPAEDLEELNRNIVGKIDIVGEYR